jgi:hypothetical protein
MAGVARLTGRPNVNLYKQHTGGSTTSWKAGDLVKLDATAGDLLIATAGHIQGMALAGSPGDVTTDCPVDVFTSDDSSFCVKYGTTTAATLPGKNCDVTFTTGAITVVDGGGTGDFIIEKVDGRDTVGTSGGRVVGRFLETSLDAEKGL